MANCDRCGTQVRDAGARFCPHCGSGLPRGTTAAAAHIGRSRAGLALIVAVMVLAGLAAGGGVWIAFARAHNTPAATAGRSTTIPTATTSTPRADVVVTIQHYKTARKLALNQGHDLSTLSNTADGPARTAVLCIVRDGPQSQENSGSFSIDQPVSYHLRSVQVRGDSATAVEDKHEIITIHRADVTLQTQDDTYTETYDLHRINGQWLVHSYSWTTPQGDTGGATADDSACQATPVPTAAPTPTDTPVGVSPPDSGTPPDSGITNGPRFSAAPSGSDGWALTDNQTGVWAAVSGESIDNADDFSHVRLWLWAGEYNFSYSDFSSNSYDFEIVSSDGTVIQPDEFVDTPTMGSSDLPPGTHNAGWIVFRADLGATYRVLWRESYDTGWQPICDVSSNQQYQTNFSAL